MKLYAPESYWEASEEVRRRVLNGCGTSGWKESLVPETVYGLSVHSACDIHDWMYVSGSTLADKEEADRVFLNNMLRIVAEKGGWLYKLRRLRVHTYYEAVEHFGGPAFWDGKNKEVNIQEVVV